MSLPTDEIMDEKNEKMGQFPCSICSRIYGTHNSLSEHILAMHLKTEHKCHLCNQTFPLERKLKSHIKIVHEFLSEDSDVEPENIINPIITGVESLSNPKLLQDFENPY